MARKIMLVSLAVTAGFASGRRSEFRYMKDTIVPPPLSDLLAPHEYLAVEDLPDAWDWHNVNGTSFVTHSLNQHIPQYCGSCWAHGAMSALADRVKIARKAQGDDINFSIQQILNCGSETAGSCHGGSAIGAYQFVKEQGYIPYDTCMPYLACSNESTDGFCSHVDTTCPKNGFNVCRTCSTFVADGGECVALDEFPNAKIADYGQVTGADKMAAEIYARGPIACGINAGPALNYTGGIFDDKHAGTGIDHIISVTGWGMDKKTGKQYWNVRNSWGQYWGELGYMRVVKGENQLGIESQCSWATLDSFTEKNTPCFEGGENCQGNSTYSRTVTDPSLDLPFKGWKSLFE